MIKLNTKDFVKKSVLKKLILITIFIFSKASFSNQNLLIEAEEFPVTTLKFSKSKKIILFKDESLNRPNTGKILLIKNNTEEIVAVRVLKNFEDSFAGKIIYKNKEPELNVTYRAIKKIGILTQKPNSRIENPKDLLTQNNDKNLKNELIVDDAELDKGIPIPQPKAKPKEQQVTNEEVKRLDEIEKSENDNKKPLFDSQGNEIDNDNVILKPEEEELYYDPFTKEIQPLNPKWNAISIEYASIRSYDSQNNRSNYSAIGLRYTRDLDKMLAFQKENLQDSLSLELGIFLYSITNFRTTTDSITILPVTLTLNYNLHFNEYFMLTPYLGLISPFITQAQGVNDLGLLNKKALATGLSSQLKLGPGWSIRIDFGTDMFATGVVLKF
jgi:hypothetical protein